VGMGGEAGLFGKLGSWLFTGLSDAWDVTFFLVCCIAAYYLPSRKPEIWSRSPFHANPTAHKVISALAIIGNIVAVYFIWDGLDLLKGWFSTYWLVGWGFLILWPLFGYLVYKYYSNRARQTGVEMTTIFTEIPPD
jgi:hypothetical protein